MNVLFVNYGDFTTNSLNHIGGFANALCARGHACAVAVPKGPETLAVVRAPLFIPLTYDGTLERPRCFPDGRGPDVIHAWTPRECVRRFTVELQARLEHPARVVVHLEDNETHLLETYTHRTERELRELPPEELAALWTDALAHPVRAFNLLRLADAVTVIEDRLADFVPEDTPHRLLRPGVDPVYAERADPAARARLRAELGIEAGERVIVFTGSTTFANEPEMRDLYLAVALLNQRGLPTRLVRTGFTSPQFAAGLTDEIRRHVSDLGFIEKARLPALLQLADALVQPGRAGAFNDHRLPSKLPEFLASGRPVILPATNIGRLLRDGVDALLLREGSPGEIAAACARLFADPALAASLGAAGAEFAARHFDLATNSDALAALYAQVLAGAPRTPWARIRDAGTSDVGLLAERAPAPHGGAGAGLVEQIRLLEREHAALTRDAARGARVEREAELTARHAANLDGLLAQTRRELELARAHSANLEHQLAAGARTWEQTVHDLARARAGAEALRQQLATVRDERARAEAAAEAARRELSDELAAVRNVLEQRNRKVRAMQDSFSWRSTAPLRALRRALVSPPAPPAGNLPVETARATPRAAEHFTALVIDEPADWSRLPRRRFTIRGWALRADGGPLPGLRARCGAAIFEGKVGLKRVDVRASHPDHPRAAEAGFAIEVRLEGDERELVLEADEPRGGWTAVRTFPPSLAPDATEDPADAYVAWMRSHEDHAPAALRRLAEESTKWEDRPLVSILVPVYDSPEPWLLRAVASVRAQTYDRWELCLADDASTAPHVRPLLERLAAADPRLKVCFRETNGHISAASNSALGLATGDWIALLDHDDELAPDALHRVVAELRAFPETDLVYSDEDKIDTAGRRSTPYFKPDFLPDLFTAQNFISHLAVYRTSIVRGIGGFRIGLEGSQDWDLALRFLEKSDPSRVRHIPRVLYHWRAIPGSTALDLGEKAYPLQAARRALAEHFQRRGESVELLPVEGGHWRVRHPVPEPAPLVSLVIPTRDGLHLVERCVESILRRTTYPAYEILIVDNASDDPATLEWLGSIANDDPSRGPAVRVLRDPSPFNYSALNNRAVAQARGAFVGLLNNDLEVITPGWLDEMVAQAARPGVGCVGAMLHYPDDTIQHAGVVLGIGGVAGHAFKRFPRGSEGAFNRARLVQNYSAVTAACLVVRKDVYERVGGLGEHRLAVAFNDIDFCLKVRALGLRNLWTPFAELYHHESASRGQEDTPEKHARFRSEIETMLERWAPLLAADPAYNPNLTLEHEDFSITTARRPHHAART